MSDNDKAIFPSGRPDKRSDRECPSCQSSMTLKYISTQNRWLRFCDSCAYCEDRGDEW